MKHLLTIEQLDPQDIQIILHEARQMKAGRGKTNTPILAGQTWALLFTKASTRTRVSFEVGIHELGGNTIFLSAAETQLGRGEPIRDTARVLGRMVHGAIIRTYAQSDVEEFARYAQIPTINALTDEEHPCQILSDIFTYEEKRGSIKGKKIAFIGDGACNVARSWMWAAKKLQFQLYIASPKEYFPPQEVLLKTADYVTCTTDPIEAARGAEVLYTDVWVSMGKESESQERLLRFTGYQINKTLLSVAKPDALVMHCLPAYRGKEIDEETFEAHAKTIFDQAENRLHVQKAILKWALS